jgi:hypothetical protein
MMISNRDIDTINEIILPLLGHVAHNVKLGLDNFITLEFGNTIFSSRGKAISEWFLWIYYCGWYIEKSDGTLIGSDDPREVLKQEVTTIEGHILEAVIISPIAFETNFVFDRGLVLHTFPLNFIDPSEYWKLYTPQGKVLNLGPAPKWSFELSSISKPL